MSNPTDQQLLERWRDEPAPLLPLLHSFHDRDGYLSDDALHAVADGLRIPIAELFGTVTFYHHFSRAPGGRKAPRVCTGNVCALRGAHTLLKHLEKDGATSMPCSGRCDETIPVIHGDRVLVGSVNGNLEHRPTPLPPPNPGGLEECVFAHGPQPDIAEIVKGIVGRGFVECGDYFFQLGMIGSNAKTHQSVGRRNGFKKINHHRPLVFNQGSSSKKPRRPGPHHDHA